jgi:hypothetical protein
MEDIFFFTKSSIKLEDVAKQAEQAGYEYQYLEAHFQDLKVISLKSQNFWVFAEIVPNSGMIFDENPQHRIDTYNPASAFMVSYHVASLPELAMLMKILLTVYEGWVGCDDDFDTIYDLQNIDQLTCF